MYKEFDILFELAPFYLTLVVGVVLCLTPDITFKYLKRQIFPKSWHILQEEYVFSKKRGMELFTLKDEGKKAPLLANEYGPGGNRLSENKLQIPDV